MKEIVIGIAEFSSELGDILYLYIFPDDEPMVVTSSELKLFENVLKNLNIKRSYAKKYQTLSYVIDGEAEKWSEIVNAFKVKFDSKNK